VAVKNEHASGANLVVATSAVTFTFQGLIRKPAVAIFDGDGAGLAQQGRALWLCSAWR
jgi:hypothetical protein